jgi:xylulose-5-phosphate/fructose-6-phosphate phosphoketolase
MTAMTESERPLSSDELEQINAWWRAANYLSVGQIYLLGNPLLREPLRAEHVTQARRVEWGSEAARRTTASR